MKKIFILMAHPNKATLTGALANAYEKGALSAGHEVRRQNLGEMQFDPILHKGYKVIQELEPDLQTFQDNVRWADHLVFLYPNWWGTMPALLKGLIDRTWLPGFAFRFHKTGPMKGLMWEPLLKGKTARIVICANTLGLFQRLLFGDFTNELRRATLGFAGIRTRVSDFSPSEKASDATRAKWLAQVGLMGKNGA
jgi:putative NADPH-quinone reductase